MQETRKNETKSTNEKPVSTARFNAPIKRNIIYSALDVSVGVDPKKPKLVSSSVLRLAALLNGSDSYGQIQLTRWVQLIC